MLSKIASSSRSRALSCSRRVICCASFCCAVRSMETLLSAALAIARSRSSSARSGLSSLRAGQLLLDLAAVEACEAPPGVVHPDRERGGEREQHSEPSQRRYQGTCVRTATLGAAMPKRWRSFPESSGHHGTTRLPSCL